jgi:hypothetical protein
VKTACQQSFGIGVCAYVLPFARKGSQLLLEIALPPFRRLACGVPDLNHFGLAASCSV